MSMVLSQTAEYAIRAMAHLASREREGPGLRASDLADEISVPLPYLQKILRRLVVAGLLSSQKGHGGGFKLCRPPKQVRFSEILRAADFELDDTRCAFGWGDCDPAHPCPMHPAWQRLNESMARWADSTTLADVSSPPAPAAGRGRRRRGVRR